MRWFGTWLVRAVIGLHLCLALLNVGTLWLGARQDFFWRADFTAFYTGWAMVRDGEGAHLYDLGAQAAAQARVLADHGPPRVLLPYINPPHATVPFVPLAWLPRSVAYQAWMGTQILLLAWALRRLARIARAWSRSERWLMLSAVLALDPLLKTFILGSFSLLILLCYLQAYQALAASREARGGLWLAAGTIKPQAVLLPFLMLAGARRRRALSTALILLGALAAVAVIVLGWRSWLDYAALVRAIGDAFGTLGVFPTGMSNVKGTLALLLGAERRALINGLAGGALAAAAVATLLLWRGGMRPEEARFPLRLGLTFLLGMLVSPHLNPQDNLLALAPAVLFYVYLRERGLPRRAYGWFALSGPLFFLVSERIAGDHPVVRGPFVFMIVLLAWMGWALRRDGAARAGGRARIDLSRPSRC